MRDSLQPAEAVRRQVIGRNLVAINGAHLVVASLSDEWLLRWGDHE
ncbi:hypothetical protein [Micromonospora sp. AB353]